MTKKTHLDCLKRGVDVWNKWRDENPETISDLEWADLEEVNLFEANLRNANLQRANFTMAKDFTNAQIGGANLACAQLPVDDLKFEGITQVDSAIEYSQRILIILVLGCIYTWLTIATTSDANLITHSISSSLPIIDTPIQIGGFYFVAPIVLVCMYCYLHISLQRLWERLAALPAVFPDGQSIDKKISPWLFTGLVYKHFVHLKKVLHLYPGSK
jgi:hypothetical protein